MTVQIDVKNDIIGADSEPMYQFFGMNYVAPEQIQNALASAKVKEDIEIDIDSNGGEVSAASQIYSMLKAYPGQVNVFIQGIAASAASIIAMAGDKISISPTAQIMIHKCLAATDSANADELRQMAAQNDSVDIGIANAYMLKTGMSQSDLFQLMSNQTFMDAKTAIDKGFADEMAFTSKTQTASDKAPVFANSIAKLPSRETIDKFNLLMGKAKAFDKISKAQIPLEEDSEEVAPKENKKTNSQPSLRQRKLAILLGDKK